MDINDVTFYAIAPDDETLAYVIDPPSDTKEVVIPSPPSKKTVKINPREAVILFTKEPITEAYSELDALKAYAKENKLFIVSPSSTDTEVLSELYEHLTSKAITINIKKDEMSVRYMDGMESEAQAFVDYAVDELDADLEDAEEFEM